MRCNVALVGLVVSAGLTGACWAQDSYNMAVRLDGLSLGNQLMGDKTGPADLKNRVVLVEMWGVNCPPCVASLPKLAKLYDENREKGLTIVGIHRQNATADQIRTLCQSKGVTFPIYESGSVSNGDDFRGIPHVFLFDHTGACVYRGSPDAAISGIPALLAAAPAALLDGRDLVKLKRIAVGLKANTMTPAQAHATAAKQVESSDEELAEEAKFVVERVEAYGSQILDRAESATQSDPATALRLATQVSRDFKGMDLGTRADAMVKQIRADKALMAEVSAAEQLEELNKLVGTLRLHYTRSGELDVTSNTFKNANRATLGRMIAIVRKMKKDAPDSEHTRKAGELLAKYGL